LAEVAADEKQPERAARLIGAAASLRDAIGVPLSPSERGDYDRLVAALRGLLGDAAFTVARDAGRALGLAEAVDDALEEECGE
jgi:hypothetical protein